jgi:hypothetical protein
MRQRALTLSLQLLSCYHALVFYKRINKENNACVVDQLDRFIFIRSNYLLGFFVAFTFNFLLRVTDESLSSDTEHKWYR